MSASRVSEAGTSQRRGDAEGGCRGWFGSQAVRIASRSFAVSCDTVRSNTGMTSAQAGTVASTGASSIPAGAAITSGSP